ncbi:MAG TPA: VOC family protein [Allosphingosinicella sp.]|nr:VOC family protein [Allosphingosinicella sp.]
MSQSLAHIALVVRDYDEAIAWFTEKLGFALIADERVGPEPVRTSPGCPQPRPGDAATGPGPTRQAAQDKRWVLVAPPGGGCSLLLARAATPEQEAFIGDQSGGRVFLFLATDDFDRDFGAMTAKGVAFVRPPAVQPYGKVAVFLDLYGNKWDLVEFAGSA